MFHKKSLSNLSAVFQELRIYLHVRVRGGKLAVFTMIVNVRVVVFLGLLGLPLMVIADIPSATDECRFPSLETTPSHEFKVVEGFEAGVVRHVRTGLEWRRCVEGMAWDPTTDTCEGTGFTRSWGGALQRAAESEGWRVPNLTELRSIVERCRAWPSINQQVFPNTPRETFYWTSSPYAGSSGNKWLIFFNNGYDNWGSYYDLYLVRLVRDVQ